MTILLSYLFLCSAISKVLLLCNIFTNILSQWLLSPILDLPKPRNFIPRGYYSFESTFSTPDELHSYFRTESASGLNYLQCWSIHSPWSFTKLWGCENETLPLKSFTRHKVQCTRWQKAQFLNQDARPLILEFSSVQSLSHVQLFVTPWTAARQASLSITNSRSLPKPMSIESVMPSNHLILYGLSSCPQSFPASGSSQMSQLFTSGGQILEFQLQHPSFQWIFRTGGLVGSPCSPRDSREPSPTSQFKSISPSALSLLYSATLTSIHDYWKKT